MSSQQQGMMSWANVAGFAFALGGMVAVNLSEYKEDLEEDRAITLHLLYGIQHTFISVDADEFFKWWTELSTPKHVQGVQGIIRPA